jgi:hypothetical protein
MSTTQWRRAPGRPLTLRGHLVLLVLGAVRADGVREVVHGPAGQRQDLGDGARQPVALILTIVAGLAPILAAGSDTPRTGFSRTWTIASDTPQVGVAQLNVAVSWADYTSHTITVTTVVNE